ncbi:MAG: cardiolipin synthase [Candidatus Parcubacteria bacterium]|jgi:cardiolipin synthase|nr:cardiolipin synthase [Candidatus Parcubacteria bacterium]
MAEPTRWKLYAQNEEAWLAMLTDCARARKTIVLEQFIFVKDDFGQKLINICAERAKAGVRVRFLWDAAGSFTFFGSNIADELKGKGIDLLFWRTLIPGYFRTPNFRSWFLRNHRRTLVIDDAVGYTGSISVQDSMRNWRDTNVRLEGSVVLEMSNAFERMWARAKKVRKLPPRTFMRDPKFRYITNNPAPGQRHIYSSIVEALREAKRYAYITTPYFVPTGRLLRAIRAAAKRGVDVRIIIPERSDHYPSLDLGARSFFTSLLEAGVRIFLYPNIDGAIIHSKTIAIDDGWGTVGSLNLDHVSLLYNFEANIISLEPKFADELASHFISDLEKSKEILLAEWRSRFFIERIPEILIRLVRQFL